MKQYGHIKLSRKFFECDDLWNEERERSYAEAWIDLIQMAAWRKTKYLSGARVDAVNRGEFVASLRYLGTRWMWGKNKVARFLKMLEKAGQIAGQRPGQHGTVYLIVKYDAYQSVNAVSETPDGTDSGTDAGHLRDKEEAGKQLSSKATTTPGANAPAPKAARKTSGAKYPAFPDEDCGLLWAAWNQTLGAVEYSVFRKALGSFYQAAQTPPDVRDVTNAITAYREAVDEMDEREAGFQTVHKFAQRLDNWIRVGAMPYSTDLGVLTERGRVLGSKAMREQNRGMRSA